MSYEWLRHFADSWTLLAMLLFYLSCVAYAFLPRNRQRNRDAANIIFRDADHG
jgi:cytochrome c oxidase cbb3-type subunit IV